MTPPPIIVGDHARLMITHPATGLGHIRDGVVSEVGPAWARVRVGNESFVLSHSSIRDHERRCVAAELADARAKAKAKR